MAFTQTGKTGSCCWGIWEITETEQELTESLEGLHRTTEFTPIRNSLQRRQSMAGKLALKMLMAAHGHHYTGISKQSSGKPVLKGSPLHISISHSGNYAAVCFDTQAPVGIDIERISSRVQRVAHKFIHESERETAEGSDESLTYFWCAKEALYKVYGERGVIFNRDLRVNRQQAWGLLLVNGRNQSFKLLEKAFGEMIMILAYDMIENK